MIVILYLSYHCILGANHLFSRLIHELIDGKEYHHMTELARDSPTPKLDYLDDKIWDP